MECRNGCRCAAKNAGAVKTSSKQSQQIEYSSDNHTHELTDTIHETARFTHVNDHVKAEIAKVDDGLFLMRLDLSVLHQLVQTLFGDAVLNEHVQKDDPHLIVVGDSLVQQDGNDVPHMIFDTLTFGICAHCQILDKENAWMKK